MRKHTRPKTGGRAKGTPNRLTTTLRETIQEALEAEAGNLPDLLAQLKPSERVAAFTRLAQLVLPPRPQADQEHIEQPLFAALQFCSFCCVLYSFLDWLWVGVPKKVFCFGGCVYWVIGFNSAGHFFWWLDCCCSLLCFVLGVVVRCNNLGQVLFELLAVVATKGR